MARLKVTYSYMCYSVLDGLKQSFADKTVTFELVLFWVIGATNKLMAAKVKKEGVTGSYINTFTDIPVKVQYTSVNNIFKGRKYIELPAAIMDLDNEQGVNWLSYQKFKLAGNEKIITCEPVYFEAATMKRVREMSYNPMKRANEDHPYFVRLNSLLYLFGIENLPKVICDAALITTADPIFSTINYDDELPINGEEAMTIIQSVLSLGRWMMQVPKERAETGGDERIEPPKYQNIPTQDQPQQQS